MNSAILDGGTDETDFWADSPVVAFVNLRSGNLGGKQAIARLRNTPQVCQIFDLRAGGPVLVYDSMQDVPQSDLEKMGLEAIQHHPKLRILIGGGDGSIGWIIGLLEAAKIDFYLATFPLGTSNDLAYVLGWGRQVGSPKAFEKLMKRLHKATLLTVDRWSASVSLIAPQPSQGEQMVRPPEATESCQFFTNYFSLGFDGQIVEDFHSLREKQPALCVNRHLNKFWYVWYGIPQMNPEKLCKRLELEVDGRPVKIPRRAGSLILVNIPSYAAGMDLWGKRKSDDQEGCGDTRSAIDDGKLEIVCIDSPAHLALTRFGMMRADRIGQGKSVLIRVLGQSRIPVQVDGEPWGVEGGREIRVTLRSRVKVLAPTKTYSRYCSCFPAFLS